MSSGSTSEKFIGPTRGDEERETTLSGANRAVDTCSQGRSFGRSRGIARAAFEEAREFDVTPVASKAKTATRTTSLARDPK